MRIAIAISVLFGLPCCSTQAAFTDFSDYPHYQLFEIGEIFESQGLVFKAVEFQSNGTHVAIGNSLSVGPGVEFLLPAGVQEVSLWVGSSIAGPRFVLGPDSGPSMVRLPSQGSGNLDSSAPYRHIPRSGSTAPTYEIGSPKTGMPSFFSLSSVGVKSMVPGDRRAEGGSPS